TINDCDFNGSSDSRTVKGAGHVERCGYYGSDDGGCTVGPDRSRSIRSRACKHVECAPRGAVVTSHARAHPGTTPEAAPDSAPARARGARADAPMLRARGST